MHAHALKSVSASSAIKVSGNAISDQASISYVVQGDDIPATFQQSLYYVYHTHNILGP